MPSIQFFNQMIKELVNNLNELTIFSAEYMSKLNKFHIKHTYLFTFSIFSEKYIRYLPTIHSFDQKLIAYRKLRFVTRFCICLLCYDSLKIDVKRIAEFKYKIISAFGTRYEEDHVVRFYLKILNKEGN